MMLHQITNKLFGVSYTRGYKGENRTSKYLIKTQ